MRTYIKQLVAVILAVVLVLAMVIPALAQTTVVEVTAGGGGPPLVKCNWETPDDGDPAHAWLGTSMFPSCQYGVDKDVQFWAVVTDPEGVDTVANVYADVYHPEGPPECGSKKYQLELYRMDKEAGIAAFEEADAHGLITYGWEQDYTLISHQLEQGLSAVYMGTQVLSYHQPAGLYRDDVKAYDIPGNPSMIFSTYFYYIPVAAIEVDFTHVNYGSVQVCSNKWIGGDLEFGTPAPTVRNIGNTTVNALLVKIRKGLGLTSGVWNVEFDARLGADGVHAQYFPEIEVTLVDVLPLCNTQKLDFSIHVIKGDPGTYTGTITIGCLESPFGP